MCYGVTCCVLGYRTRLNSSAMSFPPKRFEFHFWMMCSHLLKALFVWATYRKQMSLVPTMPSLWISWSSQPCCLTQLMIEQESKKLLYIWPRKQINNNTSVSCYSSVCTTALCQEANRLDAVHTVGLFPRTCSLIGTLPFSIQTESLQQRSIL